jgi:hypothetical protein
LKLQKSKLILVEGRDEEEFFGGLLHHLEIDDIQVIPVGGKDQFAGRLQGLIKDNDFADIVSMGIVRDADDDPKATLQSIGDALKQASLYAPAGRKSGATTGCEYHHLTVEKGRDDFSSIKRAFVVLLTLPVCFSIRVKISARHRNACLLQDKTVLTSGSTITIYCIIRQCR